MSGAAIPIQYGLIFFLILVAFPILILFGLYKYIRYISARYLNVNIGC